VRRLPSSLPVFLLQHTLFNGDVAFWCRSGYRCLPGVVLVGRFRLTFFVWERSWVRTGRPGCRVLAAIPASYAFLFFTLFSGADCMAWRVCPPLPSGGGAGVNRIAASLGIACASNTRRFCAVCREKNMGHSILPTVVARQWAGRSRYNFFLIFCHAYCSLFAFTAFLAAETCKRAGFLACHSCCAVLYLRPSRDTWNTAWTHAPVLLFCSTFVAVPSGRLGSITLLRYSFHSSRYRLCLSLDLIRPSIAAFHLLPAQTNILHTYPSSTYIATAPLYSCLHAFWF
jgi:hypothetical protein